MKVKNILATALIAYLVAATAIPAFAAFSNTCVTGNDGLVVNTGIDQLSGSSQYDGLNGGLYGPATSTGSNDMTAITGGTQHLTDGQLIANGTGVSGGPAGITPLCANGSTPSGGVCGDGSTASVGVTFVGMSSVNRISCSLASQTTSASVGTFLSACVPNSFLLAVQSTNAGTMRFDNSGTAAFGSLNFNSQITWVNGAQEAQGLNQWVTAGTACNQSAADPACDTTTTTSPWYILKNIRTPNFAVNGSGSVGLNVNQVQVVFLFDTYQTPGSLATFGALNAACATTNVTGGGGTEIVGCDMARYFGVMTRELKQHIFPNLKMVFLTSLYYEGYAAASVSPPPCGYEGGFAAKEAIEAQITQDNNGTHTVQDAVVGDLCYETGRHSCPSGVTAPWLGWGPYIWANGTNNSNKYGVNYAKGAANAILDYNSSDFTHPSTYGSASTQSLTVPTGTSKIVYQFMHFLNDNSTTTSGGDTTAGGTGLTSWAVPGVGPTPTPTATPTPSYTGSLIGSLCQ